MYTEIADQFVILLFIALLGWAAFSDFRDYVIPNRLSLSVAILYPAHVAASAMPVDWLGAVIVAGVVFVIGIVLFAFRVAGGGDVKLLAAVALWAGPIMILPFLLIMAMVGGFLAVATLRHLRFLRPWPSGAIAADEVMALKLKSSVPYGIAIASGGLWVATQILMG